MNAQLKEYNPFCATRGRTVTFWLFSEDGKIKGEDIYSMSTDFADAEEVNLKPYTYGKDE